MGVHTLSVEYDLLAEPPCALMVHIAEVHFAFNFVERLALIGQHAEKGRTSCTGSAENEELRSSVNNCASLGFGFTHHLSRFDLAANLVQNSLAPCQFLQLLAHCINAMSIPS